MTTLPPGFAAAAERLKSVSTAGMPTDLEQGWTASYASLIVLRNPGADWRASPIGGLSIRRSATRSGKFAMAVESMVALPGGQRDRASAVLDCRADRVGSLIGWRMTYRFESDNDGPAGTRLRTDRGSVRAGRILRSNGQAVRAHEPVAANWGLFDSARRCEGATSFLMLEELDAVRPHQRMQAAGETEIATASGRARLRCVLQTGDGILPTTWWLHTSGLPLLVLGNLRAFVFDPGVVVPELRP